MFAHRRVACTASRLDGAGAQFDDATDEIEDDREGRDDTFEYAVEMSDNASGDDMIEADVAVEVRRLSGSNSRTFDFHSVVRSSVHLAKEACFI